MFSTIKVLWSSASMLGNIPNVSDALYCISDSCKAASELTRVLADASKVGFNPLALKIIINSIESVSDDIKVCVSEATDLLINFSFTFQNHKVDIEITYFVDDSPSKIKVMVDEFSGMNCYLFDGSKSPSNLSLDTIEFNDEVKKSIAYNEPPTNQICKDLKRVALDAIFHFIKEGNLKSSKDLDEELDSFHLV